MRDKYEHTVDPYQLAQELPYIIDAPLVDLDPQLPLYDEVVSEVLEAVAYVDRAATCSCLSSQLSFFVGLTSLPYSICGFPSASLGADKERLLISTAASDLTLQIIAYPSLKKEKEREGFVPK